MEWGLQGQSLLIVKCAAPQNKVARAWIFFAGCGFVIWLLSLNSEELTVLNNKTEYHSFFAGGKSESNMTTISDVWEAHRDELYKKLIELGDVHIEMLVINLKSANW